MVKVFCDKCGREITNGVRERVGDRIKRQLGKILVEVMVGCETEGGAHAWNGGQLCTDCVIAAVLKGKDFE